MFGTASGRAVSYGLSAAVDRLSDAALPKAQVQQAQQPLPAYKSKWQKIVADNGAAYDIDLNSIRHWADGQAEAVIYIVESDTFNPFNMKRVLYDCHGHMTDISGAMPRPASLTLVRI